jgi:hypothetical protein
MPRSVALALLLSLAVAGAAQAQMGGGGGYGGGGGGGRGHGGGGKAPPAATTDKPAPLLDPRPKPPPPTDQVEIVGVVRDVDTAGGRITIAYDEVEALNWPAGSLPFQVAQSDLMKGVTVGEKVRFKISSQQIWSIEPYVEKPTY